MKRLAGALAVLALAGACAGGTEVSGDRRVVGDVTVVFTVTPSRVEVGRPVRFALRLTNHAGRDRVLPFSTGQIYDFWVTAEGREVWRWSDDRSFTQALTERSIPPQDTITFSEAWTASPAGDYIAHGIVRSGDFERELTGRFSAGG